MYLTDMRNDINLSLLTENITIIVYGFIERETYIIVLIVF